MVTHLGYNGYNGSNGYLLMAKNGKSTQVYMIQQKTEGQSRQKFRFSLLEVVPR